MALILNINRGTSARSNLVREGSIQSVGVGVCTCARDSPSGKGVLTSVNDRLEKLLNKQDHLQTSMSVLLEHKPYEDELLENIQLTKKYISERTAQSEKDISLKEETLQAQIVTLQAVPTNMWYARARARVCEYVRTYAGMSADRMWCCC